MSSQNVSMEEIPIRMSRLTITLLSNEDVKLAMVLILTVMSIMGVVFNIINIVVFSRMKTKEPINITLMGMAVSDMMLCFTLLVMNVTGIPKVQAVFAQKYSWNPSEVFYISFGMPQTYFARITIAHTALITIERCLCVVFPLKVKMIVTRNRAKGMVVIAFLLGGSLAIPNYLLNRLGWVYKPYLNKTIFGHVQVKYDGIELDKYYTSLDVFFFFIVLYVTISVCTGILIVTLRRKRSWRKTISTGTETSSSSGKEAKIARMVIIISSIFMICFFPNSILFVFSAYLPAFSLQGENLGIIIMLNWCVFVLETVNSIMNIFIYYSNSSNYRDTFNDLFHIKDKSSKEKSST